MRPRFIRFFYWSAAVLLLFTAAAKLYSITGHARLLSLTDSFMHVSHRMVMVAAAVAEVAVASLLLFGRRPLMPALALLWLSGNFILYRIGSAAMGVKYCPCLGTLGQKLPISQPVLDKVLTVLVLYWFFGSVYLLWRAWDTRGEGQGPVLGSEEGYAA